MAEYYIYILTNASGMLYVGLSTDIEGMLEKHRSQSVLSFKANFAFNKLVYLERWRNPEEAVSRLMYLNSISRIKKKELISKNILRNTLMQELKIKKTA